MKRKIYDSLVKWKKESAGSTALLIDGARRVGKSYIAEEFAKSEYRSYIMIDFNKAPEEIKDLFKNYLNDMDTFFMYLSNFYNVKLYERETLIILDEVQLFPYARSAVKYLVADGRYDYIETGSLMSIKKNVRDILIPSEERHIKMFPLDFEEFLWAFDNVLLMDYIRMLTHIDILVYNGLLKKIQDKTDSILKLIDNIGELDACISIASFRELLTLWCKPEFKSWESGVTQIEMAVEDLYHPLLQEAVANSFQVAGGTLVTGSNASGKSTFLKNVAMNSILAQTLVTCTCSSYQAPFLKVMTSMALRDDIESGESYFIVEIKSLKRILEESKKREPLLCIIDEVLRGTNTVERIAASSRILNALRQKWVLPFAATHDIELSYILDSQYENYHFEEDVQEKEVVFSYVLKKGRATSRNAIQLLDMLGYDKEIVEDARNAAFNFENKGIWDAL